VTGEEGPNPELVRSSPKWYRIGMGDLVLLLLALGIGQATKTILGDPGIGWHLRTPDFILEHGWPTGDPFSGPKHGERWLANQWLGDFPFWLGWKAAGLNGVTAVTIALLLLGYRLLYGYLRTDGATWPAASIWTLAAAMVSFAGWQARPMLITFLFVTILARALTLYHDGRISPKRLIWLIPLFMVWVNCHGGFIVGLVMVGLAAGIELLLSFGHPDQAERQMAKERLRNLCQMGVYCGFATLVNPYVWNVYPWVFSLLGDTYFMNLNQEWLPPDFHDGGTKRFAAFILAFPALFAVSRYRPRWTLLALSLLWLYLALQSRRYVPLCAMVVTPLLARAAAQIDWLNQRVSQLDQDEFFRVRSGGWIGYFAIVVGLAVWAVSSPQLPASDAAYSPAGLQKLLSLRQPGEVVLNGPDSGGYLTWHGWPELLVWIDDRNEVYRQEWYESVFDLEQTKPGWEEKLAEWNPTWIAIPPERPLAYRLAERTSDWEEVYRDDLLVVYRKRKANLGNSSAPGLDADKS
jgi:hypothetical protein